MNGEFEARHLIEALRSGVPSRKVGRYFSSARPELMRQITAALEKTRESGEPAGLIVAGKYGEGKTHLLHTVMDMAHDNNMVVSLLSLSKETPLDKLHLLYPKLMAGTYLPGRPQPGLASIFENMTANSPAATEMLLYSAKHLQSDKLYFLLRSYLGTEDADERFTLLADLEGDFMTNPPLKQIYKRVFSQKVSFSQNFSKTKHTGDYFAFMSHLFLQLGFGGWVLLLDETELIGRLPKKARLNAYVNMATLLGIQRESPLESTFSLFALGASYGEDVIEGKHEYENLAASLLPPAERENAEKVLGKILHAPQLLPLTKEEMAGVLERIRELHGKAYGWTPPPHDSASLKESEGRGRLLRTRIRAAIETLDQLYQYGRESGLQINALRDTAYEEDVPSLDGLSE
jgi:hypothetical protein